MLFQCNPKSHLTDNAFSARRVHIYLSSDIYLSIYLLISIHLSIYIYLSTSSHLKMRTVFSFHPAVVSTMEGRGFRV